MLRGIGAGREVLMLEIAFRLWGQIRLIARNWREFSRPS